MVSTYYLGSSHRSSASCLFLHLRKQYERKNVNFLGQIFSMRESVRLLSYRLQRQDLNGFGVRR